MTTEKLDYEPGVLRVLQSREETKSFYDKIAKVYDLLAERSEQPMREAGLKLLAAAPGERILEIGFATGHCLVELARAVGPAGSVAGIDISEKMLAEAQQLLDREAVAERVELHCGDAERLPFASDSFDGIFTSFTLELFDTPALPHVLAEWRRVLKPGGRLVVVSISKAEKPGLVLRAFEWTHRHFPNLMDCRPIYVRRALEACGYRIDQCLIEHMWVPVEVVCGVKADSAGQAIPPAEQEPAAAQGGSAPSADVEAPPWLQADDVLEIFSTDDPREAEIVRAALQSEGIRCEIDGEQQGGMLGLPIMEVKLLVRAQDADRARAFVERHQRGP